MPNAVRKTSKPIRDLHRVADLYGVQVEYTNALGKLCTASPESILQVLRILGVPISSIDEAHSAWKQGSEAKWRRVVEPVVVHWTDRPCAIPMRIPASFRAPIEVHLTLEDGTTHRAAIDTSDARVINNEKVGSNRYAAVLVELPWLIPAGYHKIVVDMSGKGHGASLIAAPRRAYDPETDQSQRAWGAFLPLYALQSGRSWGGGDFQDLAELAQGIGKAGGSVLGTLPLLAAFLDEPFEPSPYSPASRLFWNDFYINIPAIPELDHCDSAKALMATPEFAEEIAALRAAPLVNYRRQMALKRRILGELAAEIQKSDAPRRSAYEQFIQSNPAISEYARFRAAGDRYRQPWTQWPLAARNGKLGDNDFAEDDYRYHLYAQWIAEEQLRGVSDSLRECGVKLYLDLPLGVHANSFDVWKERSSFALEASGGCPPDAVFPMGQNWGFPPMHPQGIREQGYDYVIRYLRHQLKYASLLRIDHMPVFHRLYWVPQGMEACDGVYVRYAAEELYAVFSLESHRHEVLLIGEDLGTVPPEVPESMKEHHVHQMYVAQYALQPDPKDALPEPNYLSIASLNTHDMPPFGAFLQGDDIPLRHSLDLLGNLDPEKESERRAAAVQSLTQFLERKGLLTRETNEDAEAILQACLAFLAESSSRIVLLNLEDLWLERDSQNIPGTSDSVPNWQRKSRKALEELGLEISKLKTVLASRSRAE